MTNRQMWQCCICLPQSKYSDSQLRRTYDNHRANGGSAAGAALKTLGGEAKDVGVDVLLSAAGRAVDADSRRQMREDGSAVLSKVANSKPVTVAKEVFDKLLQSAENQIDMDAVQQRADEYIAKAQAMANDANFRAGFDETPYGPRHAPPAAKEDFLADKELQSVLESALKKDFNNKATQSSTHQLILHPWSNTQRVIMPTDIKFEAALITPEHFTSHEVIPQFNDVHFTHLNRTGSAISNNLQKKRLMHNRR